SPRFGLALLERAGVRLGVELDAIGAGTRREGDRLRRRVDENTDPNAARLQSVDHSRQAIGIRTGAPASLARDFSGNDRPERALIRPDLLDEIEQIRSRIAFDVVFD